MRAGRKRRDRREDQLERPAPERAPADPGQASAFAVDRRLDGPARFPHVLAAADVGARALAVGRLQRAVGNARVQRLLTPKTPSPAPASVSPAGATRSVTYSAPIRATLVRGRAGAVDPDVESPVAAAIADAPPGREEHVDLETLLAAAQPDPTKVPPPPGGTPAEPGSETPAAPTSAESSTASTTQAPASPVSLPDIEVPGVNELALTDAIAPTLAKTSSIGRGGATPSGFGVTYWTKVSVTGITVTPGSGKFTVDATVNNKVEWQTRSGTGPDGQVDISGDTDSDITKTNYPKVVTDLTPDTTDLKGRPPREKFWAEDLTIKHEEFHAKEMEGHSLAGTTQAQTWLAAQTAGSVADVNSLLGQIPGRVLTVVYAGMPETPREERAYSDGAPSYKARAEAIKKRGDEGKYT